jgi:hypothetical protein
MNNKSSSGLGCALFVFLVIILTIFKFVVDNPGIWVLIIFAAILIFIAVRINRSSRKDEVVEAFNKTADKLDALAESKEGPKNISLAVRKDERALFALYNASLVEYASTGSTFTSTNLGVSVPLFGRVRGELGGSQGSITKNPDVLTTVDTGTVVYTTQRIIFTGTRLVRDWEFEKVLNLDLGDNGSSVRIAVSNRGTTSGLKSEPLEFGAGLPAAYAYTWYQEGEKSARALLRDTAKRMRDAAKAFKESFEKPKKQVNPADDKNALPAEAAQPVGEIDPNDPASSK